jgi:hypothetical protein
MELLHVVELIGLKGVYCGLEDPTAKAGRTNSNSTGARALQRTYREAHMTPPYREGQNQSDTLSVVRRYPTRLKRPVSRAGVRSDPCGVQSHGRTISPSVLLHPVCSHWSRLPARLHESRALAGSHLLVPKLNVAADPMLP